MWKRLVYSRMMGTMNRMPRHIQERIGVSDPEERHARAYEAAYGHRPYDGL